MLLLQHKCSNIMHTNQKKQRNSRMLRFSNLKQNNNTKTIFEFIFSLTSTLLYLIVLPFVWVNNKIRKKPLYMTLENEHQITLRYFNIKSKLLKYLPLSVAILKRDVHLVGTDPDNLKQPKESTGLISLYRLRSFSGINYFTITSI